MVGDAPVSAVALIPARSGSKRVTDKNIRRLGGHPLLAYTIAAAHESNVFGAVVLSTDDENYAAIGRHYGAEVPFLRPPEFSASTSPDIEWIEYTLRRLREDGRIFDCFSILRPTSPFRQAATVRRAWDRFLSEPGIDSLRAVEKVQQHPGKMWVVRGDRMFPLMPLSPAERPWHSCQMADLPVVYVQNASLEIAWSRVAEQGGTIAGWALQPFLTDEMEGFDINTEADWQAAVRLVEGGDTTLPPISAKPYPG